MRRLSLVSVLLFAPLFTEASVVINEIMFDPSGADSGREWVELFNSGSSDVVMIAGTVNGSWRTCDGASAATCSKHTLTDPSGGIGRGSLTIPAGGYLVIATDPAMFVSEYPSGTYSVVKSSMNLTNTSATIALLDGDGAIIDSVPYTKDAGAGGDGFSLQRAGSTWIAATPTPGTENSAQASTSNGTSNQNSSATSTVPQSSSTAVVSSYVPPPATEIFADGGDNRTVIVGADTEFHGRAYNRDQELVEGVRFNWNFGDGTTGEGVNVAHHFAYPGTYAVILTIAQHISSASDRIIVTAEPTELYFAVHSDASVAITNNAGRDIDISRWIIHSFGRSFIFPDGTEILEGQTLRIPHAILGFSVGPQTELQYPNGVRAELVSEIPKQPAATLHTQVSAVIPAPTPVRMFSTEPASVEEEEVEAEEMIVSATSANLAAAEATKSSYLWWLTPIAFATLAFGAVFTIRRTKKGEWNIIDESN